MFTQTTKLAASAALCAFLSVAPLAAAPEDSVSFQMQVSAGAKSCLPNAKADVKITSSCLCRPATAGKCKFNGSQSPRMLFD